MSGWMKFLISFVIFAIVCWFGLRWFVNSEVDKELTRAAAETPGLAFSYADLSVDIFDHEVNLSGVDALFPSGQHLQAEELSITAFDQKNAFPHHATLSATGLTIPMTTQNFGQWAGYLNGLGITELSGKGGLDYEYFPETKVLNVKELYIDDPKVGVLRFSGEISNLELGAFRTEQFFALGIDRAALTFTDRSLMELLVADWARKMGLSETVTRSKVATELDILAEYAAKQENGPAENVMRGLKTFLNESGTMTVTAAPRESVPVLYFFMGRDLYENLRLLNVDIVNEQNN